MSKRIPGPTSAGSCQKWAAAGAAFLLSVLLSFCPGCGGKDATAAELSGAYPRLEEATLRAQSRFDDLCQELFQREVCENTISLHYSLTRPEDFGIVEHTPTLGDFSQTAHNQALQAAAQTLNDLESIPYAELTDSQKQTYDILLAELRTGLDSENFYLYAEPLTVNTGIHVQLPVLLAEYRFERLQDVEQYLQLLADVPRYFGDLVNFEREKAAAGLFMCDALADQVISACTDFIAQPENSYLIALFDEKLDALGLSDPSLTLSYKEKNASLVQTAVIPAYQALANGIEALKGSTPVETGLSAQDEGAAYYTYLVRSATGSPRTPEEMIDWLEADISEALTELAAQIKSDPSLADQYVDFQFPQSEPQAILADLQKKIQADFPACPAVSSRVQYIHPSLEESSSPAFYLTPPLDRLTDQRIYINRSADGSDLYPTLAHEGYPGHLYQQVYYASTNPSPLRYLLNFPGYTEGWATYAETLSYGYCDENPEVIRLMQTFLQLNLKISALSDLYVHYRGYSEEQLANFLHSVFGVRRETSREIYLQILGDPANYLSYVIGSMEIGALRKKAETALGDRFRAKDFHRFILDFGAAPFEVLEKHLDSWLGRQEKQTAEAKIS